MLNPQKEAMDIARSLISEAALSAVSKGDLPDAELPEFNIEVPADSSHGDLATNFAMASARAFHMAPRAIAQAVADRAVLDGTPFEKIEIAGPGFINLFYGAHYYNDVISSAVDRGADYGRTGYGEGSKVQVEFVSANPTGPMHLGNARGGAIGDVLASVLDRAGYQVQREFYINDTGNQIKKFGDSLAARYRQLTDPGYPFPEDGYKGEDITAHAKAFSDLNGTGLYPDDDEKLRDALVEYALPRNIDGLRTTMEKYGIEYDVWFRESSLYEDGTVDRIMSILDQNGGLDEYEKDAFHGRMVLFDFRSHLYAPLICLEKSNLKIQVSPIALNTDEMRFVDYLKTYVDDHAAELADKSLYLLRNKSKVGMGFFEAGNFYPDYILWIDTSETQYISFIDPKGLMHIRPDDPKIEFYNKIKDLEARLSPSADGKRIVLNSFIMSGTRSADLQMWWSMPGVVADRAYREARNVYTLDNTECVESMISKILRQQKQIM